MKRHHMVAIGLIVLVGATFLEVPSMDFVNWDDPGNVVDNWHYRPVTADSIAHLWREPMLGFYIPVTRTVWAGLAAVSVKPGVDLQRAEQPFSPAPFHLTNLALHAGSVLLVFALLRLLGMGDWPSAAGAAVFAVHPVQVEPVAWVTVLKDVLSGFLALSALWCYLSWARAKRDGPGISPWRFATGVACFALAVLSKQTVVVLPLIAFALDAGVLRREWRDAARCSALWLPISVAGAALATWPEQGLAPTDLVAWWQRPFVAGDALAFYLGKLIAPIGLMAHYGRVPTHVVEHWWAYFTWLAPAVLVVLLVLTHRRAPELTAAGAVFVAGLLPVLGLQPFFNQDIGTRFMYLAMLGAALAAAWAVHRLPGKRTAYAAVAILAVLAGMSMMESFHWGGTGALFERNLALNPRSWAAHSTLGGELEKAGRPDAAAAHYRAAIEANPSWVPARINLGSLAARVGDHEVALRHLQAAVDLDPEHPQAQYELGAELLRTGQVDEAIAHLRRAVALSPGMAEAQMMLGSACVESGSPEQALRYFRMAIAADPAYALAYYNLGQALRELGREDEARAALAQARRLGLELPGR